MFLRASTENYVSKKPCILVGSGPPSICDTRLVSSAKRDRLISNPFPEVLLYLLFSLFSLSNVENYFGTLVIVQRTEHTCIYVHAEGLLTLSCSKRRQELETPPGARKRLLYHNEASILHVHHVPRIFCCPESYICY